MAKKKDNKDIFFLLLLAAGGGVFALVRKPKPPELKAQATLNGTLLDDGGYETNVSFIWGKDGEAGVETDSVTIPSGSTFAVVLTGLERGTQYSFQAKAYNGVQVAYGDTLSFETV